MTANGSSDPNGESAGGWIPSPFSWDRETARCDRSATTGLEDPNEDGRYFITVRIADVNADRKPDLVTANLGDTWSMTVFVNGGKGTFRRHFDYGMSDSTSQDVGQGSEAIALGDLNGDRRADVVEARFDEVSVFVNAPGMCTVPDVYGARLAAARRRLAERHCSVGKVKRTKDATPGLVWQQRPSVGTVLPKGGKVTLFVGSVTMKRLLLILSLVVLAAGARAPVFAPRHLRSSARPPMRTVRSSSRATATATRPLGGEGGRNRAHAAHERAVRRVRAPALAGRQAHSLRRRRRADRDGRRRKRSPRDSLGARFRPEAWSSDSRHLVCSDYEAGILILDTADGTVTPLADAGSAPSWSPDGTTIAFVDEHKLYVIPAAGGTRHRLGIRKLADFGGSGLVAGLPAPGLCLRREWRSVLALDDPSRRLRRASPRTEGLRGHAQLVSGRLSHRLHPGTAPTMSPRLDGAQRRQRPARRQPTGLVYLSGTPHGRPTGTCCTSSGASRARRRPDIYVVSPTGRGGRALTHPFPTGGTNTDARWITGLHPTGTEQLPPTMSVPFKRKISFAQAVAWMATDGTRAVPRLADDKHPRLTIWDGATGRARRGPVLCGDLYGPGYLALAGDRLAWTCCRGRKHVLRGPD